ncbi:Protein of unknown function DUF3429 [Kalmanozyma brasiliensis GHG001]|uniref:Mnn4-regulates the mannosylphosphorylation n=1 Tax=Kalmanozyma brasiliensis (strain GHG001) TaxID=1365824 RepID=V5ED42_KALBG|nr:Protein of unknown function DUF3429 [Kalmanozyma brasiliensis GHG001]EST08396.1 Protein of unknown function DUF3429 [Kalmanozyma brasiliensis GHG001]
MIGAVSRSVLATGFRSQRGASATLSVAKATTLASRRTLLAPVQLRALHTSLQSRAANPQSGKPASDSWSHTKQNIKEEAKSIRSSVESAIAGGGASQSSEATGSGANTSGGGGGASGAAEILKDAKSITSEMAQEVPRPALLWGSAGIIPYVSTAAASIWLARTEHQVSMGLDKSMDSETASALLLHAQNIQVGFGAVLLSFLGAIHWGFEFSKYGGRIGNMRYAIGVLPLALGWPTLLLAPQMALIGQWAAFVAAWFIDLRATTAGWVPKWYSTYRFWLTLAVGSSIIATLAGTNYYAPNSRSTLGGTAAKLAEEVKADGPTKMKLLQQSAHGNKGGVIKHTEVGGDVEATSAGAKGDSYVTIGNPKRKEEERKEKEKEEAEKKKKEQEEKKKEQDAKAEKKDVDEKKKEDEEKEDKEDSEGDEEKDE